MLSKNVGIVRLGLWAGMAVPLSYFGTQIVAAPLYTGYRWKEQLASELGSSGHGSADIFNAGMFLTGMLTIAAVPAFWLALRRLTASGRDATVVAITLASSGGATLWAALQPLPSNLHNPGLWGAGTVLFPAALAWAIRSVSPLRALRFYLWASFVLAIAVLLVIEAGWAAWQAGLVQRGAAVLVYAPILVGALCLSRLQNSRP